jgi:adenylate cyclase
MTDQRRLAAILVADVVGYSKLVGSDEAGTLAQLSKLRREIIEPAIGKHAGRLFKSVGDGFLVEFASAVQAVTAAQAIQQANVGGALPLRIGIHLGDVVVQGDDLLGDGVNIAARVEGIAESGGVAISRAVHEQVRDKLDLDFVDKGEIELRNIARPVQVFVVGGAVAGPAPAAGPLSLPDKPSIAVLPFQNMSGDPEQDYFADGMVEDIITGLSVNKSLFVIARNSSFTYKGRAVDIRQVGRELGVRYVLEGSVRKAGNKVRITGQLIDASTGSHVWADRFDGNLDDVFELQDKVASSVIGGIAPSLELVEIGRAKRKAGNLQAYDYLLRCRANLYGITFEANREALVQARKAVALDPDFALGHAIIALVCNQAWSFGWVADTSPEVEEASRAIRRALELDRNDASVLAWCGQTLLFPLGRIEEGSALLDQAIKIDPNLARAWTYRGASRIALGEPQTAIGDLERAMRLSPLDYYTKAYALTVMVRAYNLSGASDKALPLAAEALRLRPNFPWAYIDAVVAYVLSGHLEQGRRLLSEYWQSPLLARTLARTSELRSVRFLPDPGMEIYIDALRRAGMPE